MAKNFTVGELKKVIADLPDDLELKLSSDTGVDQGEGRIIIENVYRVKYENKYGKIDYLSVYTNDIIDDDEWEDE